MFEQIIRMVLRSAVFLQVRNVCGRSRFLPLVLIAAAVSLSLLFGHAKAANLLDPPGTISGDCVGGFSCSGGDPVLCATAVADSSAACVMKKSERTVAQILVDGGFDKTLDDVKGTDAPAVSLVGTFEGVPSRGGGCPASPTAVVFGRTFTVDTGPICDLAGVIGWFMLVGAVVFGARILGG